MRFRPFAGADPVLQLIVLFLLSFMSVGLFLLMAQGLVSFLWGVNLFDALQGSFDNAQVVHINRVALLFQHLGLFIVPAVVFASLSSTNWKDYLSVRSAPSGIVIAGAVAMVCALPAINALAWANEQIALPESMQLLEKALRELEESAARLTNAVVRTDQLPLLLFNMLVIAVLPAIGEEFIFRGLVLPIFIRWTGRAQLSVWISAVLFSAMHFQFYGFFPRLLLGALLGYLFLWSRSIWVPVVAHFTNNALALVLMYFIARGDVEESVDVFEPAGSDFILLAISFPLCLGAIWYLYIKRRSLPPMAPAMEDDRSDKV